MEQLLRVGQYEHNYASIVTPQTTPSYRDSNLLIPCGVTSDASTTRKALICSHPSKFLIPDMASLCVYIDDGLGETGNKVFSSCDIHTSWSHCDISTIPKYYIP